MIVFVRIEDISDSARRVFLLLKSKKKALTTKKISQFTGIPKRTVRCALNQLKEEGVVSEHPFFKDLRKIKYSLERDRRADEDDR